MVKTKATFSPLEFTWRYTQLIYTKASYNLVYLPQMGNYKFRKNSGPCLAKYVPLQPLSVSIVIFHSSRVPTSPHSKKNSTPEERGRRRRKNVAKTVDMAGITRRKRGKMGKEEGREREAWWEGWALNRGEWDWGQRKTGIGGVIGGQESGILSRFAGWWGGHLTSPPSLS